jgi:hypothetical protein
MTFTDEQLEALHAEVGRSLQTDLFNEPEFWAEWIANQMGTDSLIEYLDLDNRNPARVAEIVERLGFDPRG